MAICTITVGTDIPTFKFECLREIIISIKQKIPLKAVIMSHLQEIDIHIRLI